MGVVSLEGNGVVIRSEGGGIHRLSRLPIKNKAVITLSSDRNWRVEVSDGSYLDIESARLSIGGEFLKLSGVRLPKAFELHYVGRGHFEAILELDLEEYLKGVLPSEMPAHWPLEALKAQAVAARSYAISRIQERRTERFHVEASILDQVYQFENFLGISTENQKKIKRAVEATQGMVLSQPGGRVHKSFYHSHCGGHTEVAERVWGRSQKNRDVATRTVEDSQCALTRSFKWSFVKSKERLKSRLASHLSGSDPTERGSIADVTPMGVSGSGRVSHLNFEWADGSISKISTQEFRSLMGFNLVKSTLFELSWDGEVLRLEGRGHGHGVGMCQHGARFMAQAGADHQSILNRYYPQAHLAYLNEKNERLQALNLLSVKNDNKRP